MQASFIAMHGNGRIFLVKCTLCRYLHFMKRRPSAGVMLYLMALLYIGAGINHFVHPGMYLKIMPPNVPFHPEMVQISGVFEIVLGALLLPRLTRSYAAFGLVLLLIAVFPANIYMAQSFYWQQHPLLWLAILRLPLQVVLIWWAARYVRFGNYQTRSNS